MILDLTRYDNLSQDELWDDDLASRYDSPGEGMWSDEVLTPTVDRLADLADGGPALEFAIGTGRVGIPLARRGVRVTGIELSRPMLDQLARTDGHELIRAAVHGDMVRTRVEGEFSLVYLVFNTIANLLTQEAQVDCFRNAAAHLSPGGRFVIELWVPDLRAVSPSAPAQVFSMTDGYLGLDAIDTANQRIISHHVHFDPSAEAYESRSARIGFTPHRYIWPSELDLMGQLAGFELESRHADWSGSPFGSDSGSHVSVYRLSPAD